MVLTLPTISSCLLQFYVNSVLVDDGTLAVGYSIKSGGNLVLGQDQDTPGAGYDSNQAFDGCLGEVG